MDLESVAAADPDKPAVIMADSGETLTYLQFTDLVHRIEVLFADRGLQPGDGVAVLARNSGMYLAFVSAAFRRGLRYTTLGTHLRATELGYIIADSGATAILVDEERARLANAALELHPGSVMARFVVNATQGSADTEGWEDLVSTLTRTGVRSLEPAPEGADFLYSSGTTGQPKGVRLALGHSPVSLIEPMPGGDRAVELFPAPLAFSAPLRSSLLRLKSGGTVVFMGKFEPRAFLDVIQQHHVTHISVVPTMFVRLLTIPDDERKNWDVSSLRVISHAGGPCPIPVKQQIIEWFGPVVYEGYSGTEYVGGTSITSQEWLEHPGSVGHAARGGVKILRGDGTEAAVGEIGNVYFTNARKFEYHNDPEKTATMFRPDGSATLGDLGYVDEDGYLYLTDRAAFTIISGGVNIYPQEVENVLNQHDAVEDVAVFGVPNEEFGEEVKAVVVLKPGFFCDDSKAQRELIALCRQHLSSLKAPRSIDFRKSLPRNDAGKLLKKQLKDEYWSQADSALT